MLRLSEKRPLFTLKLATSLDGKIATRTRHSRWITGPLARDHAHRLRAEHDAVLIGSETAIIDDPDLTCRLAGLEERSPIRIVLDSRLRLSPKSKLAQTAKQVPVWIVTITGHDKTVRSNLEKKGIEIIELKPQNNSRPDLKNVAQILASRGLTRILVEGGSGVAGALFQANLVDDIVWFRAPKLIGADGVSAFSSLGIETMKQAPEFKLDHTFMAGSDSVESYRRIA